VSGGNTNWAGNLAYATDRVEAPRSLDELREAVRGATRAHAVGSRHSFTPIADSDAEQISLRHMNRILGIDTAARTVTVEGGIRYDELTPALHAAGFALRNLASLPTITVAGAVATGTHGSGTQNLSAAVRSLKLVTADGAIATFERGDPDFDGVVVSLGALGVVAELTLDLEPSFDLREEMYLDLPLETLAANIDDIMASGHSVSLFHPWAGNRGARVLVKRLAETAGEHGRFFGAEAARPVNPASPVEARLGVAGPWHLRLPHFRSEDIAVAGNELQAEYFVPRQQAGAALRAVEAVQHHLERVLIVGEIRSVAADSLWLSPAFERDCLAIHFTCRRDAPGLVAALPAIEAALKPFAPRPHWAKIFTMAAADVHRAYPKLPAFRALRRRLDPHGKFGNPFIDEFIG